MATIFRLISTCVLAGMLGFTARAQTVTAACDGTPTPRTVRIPRGRSDSDERLEEKATEAVKRQAIESCGGSVESQTEVQDAHIVSDSVFWAARGLITSFKILSARLIESQSKDQPAQFTYEYEMTAQVGVKRMIGNPDPDFTVKASMDKPHYLADGKDSARITIMPSQLACIYIFNVASDHSISILYPTRLDPPGENCNKGPTYVFPSDQQIAAGRSLRFSYPNNVESDSATESMHLVATKAPMNLKGYGIAEAIGRPRTAGDTAASTALSQVFADMRRDDVAFSVVSYELDRPAVSSR
jgi:hypothetical protein